MAWLLYFLIITPLFILWFLFKTSRQVWNMGQNIPGPTAWPIIGNTFYFLKGGFLENILKLTRTYGPISRVWLGNDLWVVLSDPNDMAAFLTSTKHLNKSKMYEFSHLWLGTKGLLTSKSDTWRLHRKAITPSFHYKVLKLSVEVMEQNATIICDILKHKILVDEEFDVLPYIRNCALDIICEMVLGIQIKAQELNKTLGYPYSVNTLAKLVVDRGTSPWLHNDFIYGYLSSSGRVYFRELKLAKTFVHQVTFELFNLHSLEYCGFSKTVQVIYRYNQLYHFAMVTKNVNGVVWEAAMLLLPNTDFVFTIYRDIPTFLYLLKNSVRLTSAIFEWHTSYSFKDEVIEERRITLQEKMEGDIIYDTKSLLNFMLLRSNFTDEEIENEIQTFIFAGHDTVTMTLSFCLYALSQHQDVQEKLYQEIRNLFVENEGKATFDDYNKLRYFDYVIDETMRMYTTVPIISRTVSEKITLPSGYSLPESSQVILFLYGLHNNEKYFPKPDQFIPERFENRENIENFSFLPFSAGPRNCIGAKFAKLEMKIIISALLQRYKFLPSRKVKSLILESGAVLESLNKHPVRIMLRENTV